MRNALAAGEAPVVGAGTGAKPGPLSWLPAFVLAFVVVATGVLNLVVVRTPGPVATLVLVVILSAWFGGTRAGVLAIAFSLAALGYFLREPAPGVTTDVVRVAYFGVISAFVVWVIARQRGAAASLQRALEEVQRQNAALRHENAAAKELEERLRRSESEMRTVVDTIPTMAWIVLPNGRLEFLNRRWLDYTGLSLDSALFESNATMHADDVAGVFEQWRIAMAQAAPFEYEMRLRRADGEYHWFLVRTVPLLDAGGQVARWYGTAMDIEDRKRAEDAAQRTEKELREVIESIPAIAWTARPDGENEYTNRWWGHYTGLSVTETIGPGWEFAVHPEDMDRHVGRWQEAVRDAGPYESEARYRRADGSYRWFLVRGVPLLDEAGAIVRWYGVNTDIEDRKRAEQALRELAGQMRSLSRRLLEVQEEDRRHLARELHDEFGQILAAIKLHLHAARATAGEAARPSLEESMNLLQRAGEQVRSLALELRPAILDTAGLGGTLRWLARQHEQRTGVPTEVVGQWSEVGADAAIACFRVVQEALTNVAKHAHPSRVWIEMAEDEEWRHLTVNDDGHGFDVAWMLEHAPGQGHLGLLGMKERVQILRGTLQIDSSPGMGSHLRISLPVAASVAPAGAS